MKFEIHQIKLTKEEHDKINAEGHDSVAKHRAKIDMSFSSGISDLAFKAWDSNYYTHVANITLGPLDEHKLNEVFKIGNIGPENKIVRLDKMHSISVADIIVQGSRKWVVADGGFEEIFNENERKAI